MVLEGGLGETSASMAGWIAPAVAPTTRVCVYDRSGYGWSDPAPSPEDGRNVAANLHALLAAAAVAPPYVLAGHSSGGVYTRIFAGMYPTEVAGMVMLDAQPADVYTELPGWRTFYSLYKRGEALEPSLARVGVARIGYDIAPSGLPPAERAEQAGRLVHGGVLPRPPRRARPAAHFADTGTTGDQLRRQATHSSSPQARTRRTAGFRCRTKWRCFRRTASIESCRT